MKIINYTTAKVNLRRTLDEVVNDSEPTCIVSKNNQVVLINKSDYDNLIENRYVDLMVSKIKEGE